MPPFHYNLNALKAMLALTVPLAASLGLTHMLAPSLLVSTFGAEARKSPFLYSDAFMGSTFLAFASTALIGLLSGDPGSFFPLIILQGAYKTYHLLAMLATRTPLSLHNAVYFYGWLAFVAGDVYVFASAPTENEKKAV